MTMLRRNDRQALENGLLAEREQLLVHAHDELVEITTHPRSEIAGEVPDEGDEAMAATLSDLENARLGRDVARVEEIDRALDRIKAREYGHCGDCGEPIARARLLAFPTARRCIRCQRVHERTYAHAAMHTL